MDGEKYYDRYFEKNGEQLSDSDLMKQKLTGLMHFWVTDDMKHLNDIKKYYKEFKKNEKKT